jgi:pimeloyl-ACP methyl ester carboxylesterase
VFAPGPVPPGYISRTRVPLMLRPWTFRANAEDVADIEEHVAAMHRRYGAIRAPVAIVTGDSDGVVYAHIHSTGCAADIPGATLRVLEGVGHSPHHAAPDAVLEAILEVGRRAAENDAAAPRVTSETAASAGG